MTGNRAVTVTTAPPLPGSGVGSVGPRSFGQVGPIARSLLIWSVAVAIASSIPSAAPMGARLAVADSLAADAPAIVRPAPDELPVGRVGELEVILPGTELRAVPLREQRPDIVLRVKKTIVHGDRYRYVLSYYGLAPGEFDLTAYLQRVDGSTTTDLPRLPVRIAATLPPGKLALNPLASRHVGGLGGYRLAMAAILAIWLAGGLGFAWSWWRRRQNIVHAASMTPRKTIAERLEPLVRQASQGNLSTANQAKLERLLIAFWTKRLGLTNLSPSAAIGQLREHEEAGRLLAQLERWLHRPQAECEVDMAQLLRPYQGDLFGGDPSPAARHASPSSDAQRQDDLTISGRHDATG